jgi:hypothetical protein
VPVTKRRAATPPILDIWPDNNISHIQDYLFPFLQALWKHETGIVKRLELANSKSPGLIDISNQSRSGVKENVGSW